MTARSTRLRSFGEDGQPTWSPDQDRARKRAALCELGRQRRVRVGDQVIAVGNPLGLSGTVTAGIVSATAREIGEGPYQDFLQIDAPVDRGATRAGRPQSQARGHWREHGNRLALRRKHWDRLRHRVQPGKADRRPAEARGPDPARLSWAQEVHARSTRTWPWHSGWAGRRGLWDQRPQERACGQGRH